MGLDMYLFAASDMTEEDLKRLELTDRAGDPVAPTDDEPTYLSAHSFVKDEEKSDVARIAKFTGITPCEDSPSIYIERVPKSRILRVRTCVGYWRKANAIHAWFVDKVQGGVDECQLSKSFSRETLMQLGNQATLALAAYEKGKKAEAKRLLAPRAGFFFGSTDLDAYWAEDMKHTIALLDGLLKNEVMKTFHYQSSW